MKKYKVKIFCIYLEIILIEGVFFCDFLGVVSVFVMYYENIYILFKDLLFDEIFYV